MNGLITGMGNGWKAVWDKIQAIGGGVLKTFKDIFGIKSPSKETELICNWLKVGLANGLAALTGLPIGEVQRLSTMLLDSFGKLGTDLNTLFTTEYAQVFGSMMANVVGTLETMGVKLDDTTKGMLGTFAGYADSFMGLLKIYKGNVLAAMGELIIGIIEQEIIKVGVTAASNIAITALNAPLTLGASLLANIPILAAAAAGVAALEGIKGSIRSTYGSYAVGTPFVPYDQTAMVHQGEIIIPRTFSDSIRSGEMTLGAGSNQQPTIVQIWLDGRMIAEQVGNRIVEGTRGLVRADLRTITG